MKKTISMVLSIVLSALLICSAVSVGAAEQAASLVTKYKVTYNELDGKYWVDNGTKVDVLANAEAMMTAPKYPEGVSDTQTIKLTDGVYAVDNIYKDIGSGYAYVNRAWTDSNDAAKTAEETDGPKYSYDLANGLKTSFYYTFEWSELDCDVDSFKAWVNVDSAIDYTTDAFVFRQIDCAFQILVSQDNGKTYSVAYESTPFVMEKSTAADGTETKTIKSRSSDHKANGGDWTVYDLLDSADAEYTILRYAEVEGQFVQEFKNVTNIVYGCTAPRRNGDTSTDPQYYCVRMSELDVYGTNRKPITTEEITTEAPEPTTEEITTVAPEPITDDPVNTDAPKTDDPVNTDAPKTDAPVTDAPKTDDKKGCGGSVAVIGVAAVMTIGCAIIRKKH